MHIAIYSICKEEFYMNNSARREDLYIEAANIFSKNLNEKFPRCVSYAMAQVQTNILNGCNWGIVTNSSEREFLDVIQEIKAHPKMDIYKIKEGYLIFMDFNFIFEVYDACAPKALFNEKDKMIGIQNRKKALEDIEKFVSQGGRGLIGIYNLNDSNKVIINGNTVYSFSITLQDLLKVLKKYGYGVKAGQKVRTPEEVMKHLGSVLTVLGYAPSGRALMINIDRL